MNIQGYAIGDVPSKSTLASIFEPEDPDDTGRVHRISDIGTLPRVMLDPRGQVCQVDGSQMSLLFEDGSVEKFHEGENAQRLFEILEHGENTSLHKTRHAFSVTLDDGMLLVRAHEYDSYPLFGWSYYRRANYNLVSFTTKSELHQQTRCGSLK